MSHHARFAHCASFYASAFPAGASGQRVLISRAGTVHARAGGSYLTDRNIGACYSIIWCRWYWRTRS